MNIQALQANLNAVMPLLVANRNAAYHEWMDGSLARGAYEYVQSRFDTAYAVQTRSDIDSVTAYKACALLTIDIRSAVNDSPSEGAKQQMSDWLECYRTAGFTASHPLFDVPTLPDQMVRM